MRKRENQINLASCHAMVETAIHEGEIPLGYTCSYAPRAMLSTPPFFPYRMSAPDITGTESADVYLSNMGCCYTRSLLEAAMDDRYHFLGGWVFTASCNQTHRLYDNLVHLLNPPFIHILDVPHKTGDAALHWYMEELRIFQEKLKGHFNVEMGDRDLSAAIEEHNRLQMQIQEISDLRLQKNPPFSGAEFHEFLTGLSILPMKHVRAMIEQYRNQINSWEPLQNSRARLMLVGGQMDDPEFIRTIESTGALVVADHMCTGSIPGWGVIEIQKDPIYDIASHYLRKMSCPRMMEDFSLRLRSILETAEHYRVDGVILQHVKFCDIWGVESRVLMNAIKKTGVPTLCVDREYALTGVEQLRTRVQAFLERIGK